MEGYDIVLFKYKVLITVLIAKKKKTITISSFSYNKGLSIIQKRHHSIAFASKSYDSLKPILTLR